MCVHELNWQHARGAGARVLREPGVYVSMCTRRAACERAEGGPENQGAGHM